VKTVFALLLLLSAYSNASTNPVVKLNCGPSYGYDVLVEFKKNLGNTEGGFADYVGRYTGPAVDPTTGTLIRSKKINVKGYNESVDGFGKAYVLMNNLLVIYVQDTNFGKGNLVNVVRFDVKAGAESKLTCKVL
jgi:hypothetical protein